MCWLCLRRRCYPLAAGTVAGGVLVHMSWRLGCTTLCLGMLRLGMVLLVGVSARHALALGKLRRCIRIRMR